MQQARFILHLQAFFTFQPGYIQIFSLASERYSLLDFTFQPGYIQIETSFSIYSVGINFTFQPGYIQIYL